MLAPNMNEYEVDDLLTLMEKDRNVRIQHEYWNQQPIDINAI